jgi:hypothetical protein
MVKISAGKKRSSLFYRKGNLQQKCFITLIHGGQGATTLSIMTVSKLIFDIMVNKMRHSA